MANEKETIDPAPKAPEPPKAKVAGHQISIIGKPAHKVGGKVLRRGETYKASDLPKFDMAAAHKDPHVVVEPVDKDGKVIVTPPGEYSDDDEL